MLFFKIIGEYPNMAKKIPVFVDFTRGVIAKEMPWLQLLISDVGKELYCHPFLINTTQFGVDAHNLDNQISYNFSLVSNSLATNGKWVFSMKL
jgi:hypothetical protein